jgi:hypothetical protein
MWVNVMRIEVQDGAHIYLMTDCALLLQAKLAHTTGYIPSCQASKE